MLFTLTVNVISAVLVVAKIRHALTLAQHQSQCLALYKADCGVLLWVSCCFAPSLWIQHALKYNVHFSSFNGPHCYSFLWRMFSPMMSKQGVAFISSLSACSLLSPTSQHLRRCGSKNKVCLAFLCSECGRPSRCHEAITALPNHCLVISLTVCTRQTSLHN